MMSIPKLCKNIEKIRASQKAEEVGMPMKYIIGLILLIIGLIILIMLYVGWIPSPEGVVDKLVAISRG